MDAIDRGEAQLLGLTRRGGEMGGLVRTVNWAGTPVGPVESWPQALRTTVAMLLANRFPMLLMWGPELTQIYNDAYRPILGATKHPQAMGRSARETWREIWNVIGPMTDAVIRRGESVFLEDLLLEVDRYGYPEEAYFTYAYSPVLLEDGGVGGLLVTVTETTSRVIGERRLRALRDLAASAVEADSAEETCRQAARVLGGYREDLPFILLYLTDESGETAHLAGLAGLEHSEAAPEVLAAGGAWPVLEVVASGRPVEVPAEGLPAAYRGTDAANALDRPTLVLPLAPGGSGRPLGALVTGVSPRLRLDDDFRSFASLVAGQVASAVSVARAEEDARRRARLHRDELEALVEDRTAELAARNRALSAFAAFTEAVGAEIDFGVLTARACQVAVDALGAGSAAHYVLVDDRWRAIAWAGFPDRSGVEQITTGFPSDAPLFVTPMATRQPLFLDAYDPAPDGTGEIGSRFGTVAAFPVVVSGQAHSVLAVGRQDTQRWSESDKAILRAVARGLELALERAEAGQRLDVQKSELEARNAEQETFVYTVSHDLRSPLLSLQGMSELLREAVASGDAEETSYTLGRVMANVSKMGSLLDDLLTLSRVGRTEEALEDLNVGEIVHGVLAELEPRIRARGVTIDLPSTWTTVRMPRVEAYQLLSNLIGNATKFSGRPGVPPRVAIDWHVEGNFNHLRVSDNGPGVPEEHRNRVFGLFQKLDARAEGTGVGLAIVKRIAERHGGQVWAESSPLGGAAFVVTMPVPPEVAASEGT